MGVRVSAEWLGICSGCEVSILDIGEPLLSLLTKLDILHMPVLMDHKLLGQTGEGVKPDIPESDVGIITGGIRNEENKELAKEMRAKCKTLIALGTCACFGGIPALANQFSLEDLYEKVYRGSKSTEAAKTPSAGVPPLTDRVYSVHETVKVDLKIPGCPPVPEMIVGALTSLLDGSAFKLSEKSVCDECPTIREKKAVSTLKRPLESIQFEPGKPLNTVRCILEQGFLCQGPATRGGCGGSQATPRCIKAYMPCRGCFGPMKDTANPMVDMMGALSSVGLDVKQIPDRAAQFNRYCGAGKLKPVPGGR